MLKIHHYHLHRKRGYLVAVNHEPPLCPDCNSIMTVRDSKKRKAKDASGKEYLFSLRRLYCDQCDRLHTEIPDCITAFKQYDTKTIEGVISGDIDHFSGDNATMYRWKKHT